LGFRLVEEDDYIIRYLWANIRICIVFEPRDSNSDLNIRFIRENKSFSIGWIACVFNEEESANYLLNKNDKLLKVLELLTFLEKYHTEILNLEFCCYC
jgi:hypothetical protein